MGSHIFAPFRTCTGLSIKSAQGRLTKEVDQDVHLCVCCMLCSLFGIVHRYHR